VKRPLASAVGLLADVALGEPPARLHPVAVFGHVMRAVEGGLYRDRRDVGVVHAALGLALGAGTGAVVGSTALATYAVTAGHGLAAAATAVGDALAADDLPSARAALPALVGRDPDRLDGTEVARAAVESVAENTVDAVVGPALWAAVGGAPGAAAHRAVNTLDAMVGHRSPRYARYGWASARLDDAAAFVPARLTALLVAAVRPDRAGDVWRVVRRDARAHPSPNAGVAEGAFAGALGLRLGGANAYGGRVERRPRLGHGRPPEAADIGRATRLSRDVTLALAATLAALAIGRR
jgi:adenosylcobinamide-phosphate synthase